MNGLDLLAEITRQGVRIRVDGSNLAVSPEGLTESIAADIRSHKPALVRSLNYLRDLMGEDWDEILQSPDQFRAFVDAATICETRAAHLVPSHYTATVYCDNCEQRVPHFPLNVETVGACVWCMNGQVPPADTTEGRNVNG